MLIAHRGVTNKYQENTFDAISAIMALEKPSLTTDSQTCNQQIGVEFDIQQLKSGEIVIYHDETLKRLHNDPRVITEIDKNTAMNFNIAFFDSVLDLFKNTNYIYHNVTCHWNFFVFNSQTLDNVMFSKHNVQQSLDKGGGVGQT